MEKRGISIGAILLIIIVCFVLGFGAAKLTNKAQDRKKEINDTIEATNNVTEDQNKENLVTEDTNKEEVSYTEPTDDFLFESIYVSMKSELKDIKSKAEIVYYLEGSVISGTIKKGDRVALLGNGVNKEVIVDKIKYITDEVESADSSKASIQLVLKDMDSNVLTNKDLVAGQKLAKVGKYDLHTEFKVKCSVDKNSKYKTVNDLLNDKMRISFAHLPTSFTSEDKTTPLTKDNVITIKLDKGVAVDENESFYICPEYGETNIVGQGQIVEIIK